MTLPIQFSDKPYLLNVGSPTTFDDSLLYEARIPPEIKKGNFFYVKGKIIYSIKKEDIEAKKSSLIEKIQITLAQPQILAEKIIKTGEHSIKEIINKYLLIKNDMDRKI